MLKISATFAEADTDKELERTQSVATQDIYVLPFAYTQPNVRLYFQLTIINENGAVVSQKVNYGAFKPTWAKGTAYSYNVTLTGKEALPVMTWTLKAAGLQEQTMSNLISVLKLRLRNNSEQA